MLYAQRSDWLRAECVRRALEVPRSSATRIMSYTKSPVCMQYSEKPTRRWLVGTQCRDRFCLLAVFRDDPHIEQLREKPESYC